MEALPSVRCCCFGSTVCVCRIGPAVSFWMRKLLIFGTISNPFSVITRFFNHSVEVKTMNKTFKLNTGFDIPLAGCKYYILLRFSGVVTTLQRCTTLPTLPVCCRLFYHGHDLFIRWNLNSGFTPPGSVPPVAIHIDSTLSSSLRSRFPVFSAGNECAHENIRICLPQTYTPVWGAFFLLLFSSWHLPNPWPGANLPGAGLCSRSRLSTHRFVCKMGGNV